MLRMVLLQDILQFLPDTSSLDLHKHLWASKPVSFCVTALGPAGGGWWIGMGGGAGSGRLVGIGTIQR